MSTVNNSIKIRSVALPITVRSVFLNNILKMKLLCITASVFSLGQAFIVPTTVTPSRLDVSLDASRRSVLQDFSIASVGVASGIMVQNQAALASGGATAGGAYLLSAKQRCSYLCSDYWPSRLLLMFF